MPNVLLKAALRYARKGWRVFPLNGKEPYGGTRGFLDATSDADEIKAWWRQWPDANIGIACDSETGPIVIDIDAPNKSKHEKDGLKFLRGQLKAAHLSTRSAISRRGRLHLYFGPMRNGTRIKRMIRPFKNDAGRKYAIDILGDGGYVVAPPSVHPVTGKRYKWDDSKGTHMEAFPKVLFQFLRRGDIKKIAPPVPEVIHEGERDTLLTSLAGTMRRRGMSPEAILEALRVENAARVRPPLSDKQLHKIAHSIGKKTPVADDEHYTDLGNARRFVAMYHKRVRSIVAYNRQPWFIWEGSRWCPDVTGEVPRHAKLTIRTLYQDAAQLADETLRDEVIKHALKSEAAGKIRAMLELAATEPEISLTTDQLDANPWKLNLMNGTIDLKTGELNDHKRTDYITKLAPVLYNEKARAPRWLKFLDEIMAGNDELISFIQRAVGYSLTGDVREHCLFFCYGQGRNGKSTFLEVIHALLGDYATKAEFTTFQSRRGEGPRNDIARMRGARFVSATEAHGERGFDETVIKQMTGGDTLVARRLYEDLFEFRPQFKLWLAANHKPMVKEQTEAFWSRIRMIPFTVIIPPEKRQKNLGQVLQNEMSGILNWALEGCQHWRTGGLQEPESVVKATKAYKEEGDVLSEFIAVRAKLSDDGWSSTSSLYQAFTDWWMETRGHRSQPLSPVAFGRLLSERVDLRQKKRAGIRGWQGIFVKDVIA
jgi:putative DNA primase/helicase